MTIASCIIGKANEGIVDRDKAERIAALYGELFSDFQSASNKASGELDKAIRAQGTVTDEMALLDPDAAERAAQEALERVKREVVQQKRRKLLGLRAQMSIIMRAKTNPGNTKQAMLSVLEFDPRRQVSGQNIEALKDVHQGRGEALMVDFIAKYRSKVAGLTREKAGVEEIVSELFGVDTRNASAKAMAGGIQEMLEYHRMALNRYGGDIPKIDNYGLPQKHDSVKIAEADKDEWIKFTLDRLDAERMIDFNTGKPFSERGLLRLLDDVYDTLASNGLKEITPGKFLGNGSILVRRQQHRLLQFKDPASWMEYQERFGEGEIFNIITQHNAAMSRDIAITQVLGPNPESSVQLMENLYAQNVADDAINLTGSAAKKAARAQKVPSVRKVWDVVSGEASIPERDRFAEISASNRNVLTGTMLGSAFVVSVTDLLFGRITSQINGIPASRVLGRHMKNFFPGGEESRQLAVRLGFTAGGWTSRAVGMQRILGEVTGPEWSEKYADTVLRASFLSPSTDSARWAFGTEFLGFLTENKGLSFDRLNVPLQQAMTGHGITPADWNAYRSFPAWVDPESGADFIRPQDMARDGNIDVADKIQQMILVETQFAVPSTTARVRALLTGGYKPGSMWGEITRNTTMFKSFPVTIMATHANRALFGDLTRPQKIRYGMQLLIGLTVMGALATQAVEVISGRDPMSMDPTTDVGRKFWGKAFLRGGGLGIFGDFLFSDVNRFGGGLGQQLLGPVFGAEANALAKLTLGQVQELVSEGEVQNFGRDLSEFVRLMAPGRSIWYTKLAYERFLLDQLDEAVDAGTTSKWARYEKKMRENTGQDMWWKRGKLSPDRAPDLEPMTQFGEGLR